MNAMTTLANIERRISYHMQGAYSNILEVGRCLIEAKDGALVPHGQWEGWVQRTTGMSERTAQRLMQAAREVSPDSAMARLPISKITAILALPEPQREAVAVKAVEENQTLRELQATIDAMRGDLEVARNDVKRAEGERDRALEVNARISRNRSDYYNEVCKLKKQVDVLQTETQTLETQKEALREMLTEAREAQATGISDEAQAEIDRLNAALADAEQMAEYQANARQQAQQELMDLKSQAARGDAAPVEDLTCESVGVAVRVFMGTVGFLPHSEKLVAMHYQDRQQVLAFARMIGKWAQDVTTTLENVNEAVIIEGMSHE